MADTKITDLTALTTPVTGDLLPIVDVSDTSMAATGTDKKITYGNLKTQVATDLGISGTNTGDQTSIVGITGTKAQFDTAVTDGNILYVGDITQYTDELAQDAVGGMVNSTLTYVDGTPSLGINLSNANTWAADQSVPDEAYDATTWNGNNEVPTKNAVRDKIESMSSGGSSATAFELLDATYTKHNITAFSNAASQDGAPAGWVSSNISSSSQFNGSYMYFLTTGTNGYMRHKISGVVGVNDAELLFSHTKTIYIAFKARFTSGDESVIGLVDATATNGAYDGEATSASNRLVVTFDGASDLSIRASNASSNSSSTLSGFTPTNWNYYIMEIIPGASLKCWVNKNTSSSADATITTNLPSSGTALFTIGGSAPSGTVEFYISNALMIVDN